VNGVISTAGSSYPGFKIMNNGMFMRVETEFGLVVEFNGYWVATVRVPDDYARAMEGLCGNFDGQENEGYRARDFQVEDPTDPAYVAQGRVHRAKL
jgi:hypothetical protein